MTDIILFQPKCGLWDIMGIRAPVGLLNVASEPVEKGYKVVLIDQRLDLDWKEKVKKHISAGAKLVCLTTMAGEQIKYMLEISEFIKSVDSKIITVLGGSWAITEPELCVQDKNIDIVCYGEGDYLLTDIMEYCKGKKKLQEVLGIVYRNKNKEIKRTPPRPLIKNLDDIAKVPYHLIDLKKYTAVGFRPENQSISLVFSRGCPFGCTFCSIVDFYDRCWRGYSIKRIMEDLEELETKYGIKDFYINDDNIAGNIEHFSNFVNTLAKVDRDYNWGAAGIRADSVLKFDDETMENLVKSGCKNFDIGVESGSQRILEFVNKGESVETIRKANQKLSKYPIIVKYSFMLGFPTETEEEILETLKFKKTLEKENPNAIGLIFNYTPFPKTEMYELAKEHGLKPPQTLKDWSDFNYSTWYKKYPSWLTKRKIKLIENSVFLSYFANKNLAYKYPNPLMNFMYRAYFPIARFRYEKNFYGFMIEKSLADFFTKLNEKFDLFNKFKKK